MVSQTIGDMSDPPRALSALRLAVEDLEQVLESGLSPLVVGRRLDPCHAGCDWQLTGADVSFAIFETRFGLMRGAGLDYAPSCCTLTQTSSVFHKLLLNPILTFS